MSAHLASPIVLKSGEWGARVASTGVNVGDELTVIAKSGSSWEATVERVVWRGPDVTLCETKRKGSGRCSECGRAAVDADHHRAMGGLCGHCAFDEYDM